MSLFKLNDPTLISASVLERLAGTLFTLPVVRPVANGPFNAAWGQDAYYTYGMGNVFQAGSPRPVDVIHIAPLISPVGGTIDRLAFDVTVVGTAGSVARIGLYTADQQTLYPLSLLAGSGSIATDAGTGLKSFTPNPIRLEPFTLYWLAYLCGVAAPTVRNGSNILNGFAYLPGSSNFNFGASVPFAFAALPATFPASAIPAVGASLPILSVRFSSVDQ